MQYPQQLDAPRMQAVKQGVVAHRIAAHFGTKIRARRTDAGMGCDNCVLRLQQVDKPVSVSHAVLRNVQPDIEVVQLRRTRDGERVSPQLRTGKT